PPRPAWVSAGPLVVRSAPTTESLSLQLLSINQQVRVTAFSPDGKWAAVDEPATGWVSNRFLRFQSDNGDYATVVALEEATVTDLGANVRAGPGLEHPVIGGLHKGESVVIVATDANGAWKELALPLRGWVNTDLVDIQEKTQSQP
ncbi:MAG TPA: SH3 domain-containing protein, partial [Caldilineaceae bacterium]|nr:SH3 domain-containing protein [Caldilineaceae bacterium]